MNAPLTTAAAEAHSDVMLHDTSTAGLLLNPESFRAIQTVAQFMAKGKATVPDHLKGNEADCFAICMQAMQWRKNPFAVAQKTHVVHGTLGYESQLIIAIINTSGAIVGSLEFEPFGNWDQVVGKVKEGISRSKKDPDTNEPAKYRAPDWTLEDEEGLGVICRGRLKSDPPGKVREMRLLLKQARVRNSSLWADDPVTQLSYLSGKKWGRLNCPEVILGMYSPDEAAQMEPQAPRDMGTAEVIDPATGAAKPTALTPEQVAAWMAAAKKGHAAAREHWTNMGKAVRSLATEAQKIAVQAEAEKADKSRTVDNPPPASAPAPAATTATRADADGVIDDPFVSEMQAEEKRQGGAA